MMHRYGLASAHGSALAVSGTLTPTRRARVSPTAILAALALCLSALVLADLLRHGGATVSSEPAAVAVQTELAPAFSPFDEARISQAYATLPLAFTPNAGQSADGVRYLAQGAGYGFYFMRDRVVLDLRRPKADGAVALHLRFAGANPNPRLEPLGPGRSDVSYLAGTRPEASAAALSAYGALAYRDLWPGVDMVFRGEGGMLKYEFRLAPGADPSAIRLAYAGADGLSLGAAGAMTIGTPHGTLKDSRPVTYQQRGGERVPVESRYTLGHGNGYGFAVGAYDGTRPLVIDPGIAYSTYLGGGAVDWGHGIAVDASGAAYVTGEAQSADFPTAPTPGAYDASLGGGADAFVTKLNAAGTAPVYSTYLGGSSLETARAIAVDSSGQAYVTGSTFSTDFPTAPSPGAFDTTRGGQNDAFVTKLNAAGTGIVYSTYLGGGNYDVGYGIAVDGSGQAYVAGHTASNNFPTRPKPGAYDTVRGGTDDAFVAKLDAAGTNLVYSTYLGGSDLDIGRGIAVDASGQAYVAGDTVSADHPTTPGAHDTTLGGPRDAFVTTLTAAGTGLVYSTYVGGSSTEFAGGIALNAAGSAHVTGFTFSADLPTAPNPGAYDATLSGTSDAFVTKLNPAGSAPVYSTYLGGGGGDGGLAIAVDGAGQAHVAGSTSSTDFPTTSSAFDTTLGGPDDGFMTKLNAGGVAPVYSTYLGGGASDAPRGIALGGADRVYLAGDTTSTDFPTAPTPGAFDSSLGGARDAFVTKIETTFACSDGIDNDGDGKKDFPADKGCFSATDPDERADCQDGVDNDGDGTTDYPTDKGCSGAMDHSEKFACEDGVDNDADGRVDFPADPGCAKLADPNETVQCEDGKDNDADGKIDYPADPQCSNARDNKESG